MEKTVNIEKIYPLSPMQEGILFHTLLDKESTAYIGQSIFTIKGKMDKCLLEESINQLINRYEILRTVFVYDKIQKPRQIVLKNVPANVYYEDLFYLEAGDKELYIKEFARKDREKGFNLTRDILLRVSLFKLSKDSYRLIYCFHNILMDGWCIGIIVRDIMHIYNSLREGKPTDLRPVTPYKDYIDWLLKQDQEKGLKYWQEYLEGFEQPTGLPQYGIYGKGVKEERYQLRNHYVFLDERQTSGLKDLAKEKRITINTIFQAIWGILLQRYNDTDDVVFGAVVSGRTFEIEGIENMVGLFINTIPVRIKHRKEHTFTQLSSIIQDQSIISKSYEYLPLAEIQANSPLKGNLFNHIMIFENYPVREKEKNHSLQQETPFIVEDMEVLEQTNYDFNIIIDPGQRITAAFNYNASVYDLHLITNMGLHLSAIIKQVLDRPTVHTDDIEIITGKEKHQLLYDFNKTVAIYPQNKTLQELFEVQAQQRTDQIAVIDTEPGPAGTGVYITYKELNEKSNQLAYLLRHKGVTGDSIVAIMVNRSKEMITAILAIFKAGGAYLPVEPDYPQERINYLLRDSRVEILLTRQSLNHYRETGVEIIALEDSYLHTGQKSNLVPLRTPRSLAYVLYTSGSTGNPKGVMIEQRSVVNILFYLMKVYPFSKSDTYLFKTSCIFDVSISELLGWFLGGGRLAILENGAEKDPQKISDMIERHMVTHINFVPSMFSAFVAWLNPETIKKLFSLKYIFLAGEALTAAMIHQFEEFAQKIRLENIYGPTEAAIYAARYSLSAWNGTSTIPIGKPAANTSLYIVNQLKKVVPIGIPGELCIGGEGVARGYLNNPELTNSKFQITNHKSQITNKEMPSPHFTLYQTGDLARWLPDGNIEFMGRLDHQVKIRGFRIELGEIENQLLKLDGINEAVVTHREDRTGNKYLCGYIVTDTGREEQETRRTLSKTLPDYMIPLFFIEMEKLPLTPGGKVDRKALPVPGVAVEKEYEPPGNEIEEKLLDIWSEILQVERNKIGMHSNFFRLGGHSLKAIILMSRIHKELNLKVSLSEIFNLSTIRELSAHIKKIAREKYISIKKVEKKEFYPLASVQKRLYAIQQRDPDNTNYNLSAIFALEGEPDRHRLEEAFKQLIKRHESFRTAFELLEYEPVQKIHEDPAFGIEYQASGTGHHACTMENFIRPFDLTQPPLLRVGLIEENQNQYILMIDIHHIIADGISLTLLIKEMIDLYQGRDLPALRIQYKEYSAWQMSKEQQDLLRKQEQFWLNQLTGDLPLLNLPLDYERPSIQSFEGNTKSFMMGIEETKKFSMLLSQVDATLFMGLVAVFYLFLSKLSGQEDIIVGTAIAGRKHPDLQDIIGMFVNTLPLRITMNEDISFKAFLQQVRGTVLQVYDNQDYLFEDLVEIVQEKRDMSRNPLFDVGIGLQNMEIPQLAIPGLNIKPYSNIRKESKIDLSLGAIPAGERILCTFEYCTKLFKTGTIDRFIEYFKEIFTTVVGNMDIKLKDVNISHDLYMEKLKIPQEDQADFSF